MDALVKELTGLGADAAHVCSEGAQVPAQEWVQGTMWACGNMWSELAEDFRGSFTGEVMFKSSWNDQ